MGDSVVTKKEITVLRQSVTQLSRIISHLEKALHVPLEMEVDCTAAIRQLERENQRLLTVLRAHPPPRPHMLPQRRLKLAAAQSWRCRLCDEMLSEAFHADHRVPWAISYDDSDDNIDIICIPCHLQKTSIESSCRGRTRSH
jgi:hypothetical protein